MIYVFGGLEVTKEDREVSSLLYVILYIIPKVILLAGIYLSSPIFLAT